MQSKIVNFAEIAFIAKLKPSYREGNEFEDHTLNNSLRDNCWVKDANGIIEVHEGDHLIIDGKKVKTKALVKTELSRRQECWELLKKQTRFDPTTQRYQAIWESIFTENGKLIAPTMFAIGGFRRANVFADAMYRRRDDLDFTVPVLVDDWSIEIERIERQAVMTTWAIMFPVRSSPVSDYLLAERLLIAGSNQAKLRDVFGATNGVKYFWLNCLNKKYPDLKINVRIANGELFLSKIKHSPLQSMGQRFTQDETNTFNASMWARRSGISLPVLTQKEVADYLANL